MQLTVDKLNADWSRVQKYSLSGEQGFEVNIFLLETNNLKNIIINIFNFSLGNSFMFNTNWKKSLSTCIKF
jgi:hypothetical protein